MNRFLVVMPTYNERENIERIVTEVLSQDDRIDMLIVDDNSPDGTGEIADRFASENKRINVLHRAGKLGLGSAYVSGFYWALERGYELIFEMDADFSHKPEYLPEFIRVAKEYDLVLGSRYIKGGGVKNWPFKRWALSYFANLYVRMVTGLPVHDATGGFKCFRREALGSLDLSQVKSDGYAFQIELSYKLWRKGFRLKEIPIIFEDRLLGESKISRGIIKEAFFLVWKLRFGRMPDTEREKRATGSG
ncbi:MAG: dolichyl-phosphate beta-D-mannosyltransferase [candidate division Zixibacteria bacterium 4484_93]|nr:MAG: dolichyl-phosphate beta-D-mannosyltransferase [candidate division Zixibacteria bacterium 4484_93]